MSEKIKVLLVEDNPGDARLIKEDLSPLRYDLKVVDCLSDALTHLDHVHTDIILSDLSLPDSDFTHTISALHSYVPDVAIVVMTGINDKKVALEALQLGAQDFIVKGQVDQASLEQRISYAIERKKAEEGQAKQRLEIVKKVILGAKLDVQKSDLRDLCMPVGMNADELARVDELVPPRILMITNVLRSWPSIST